MGSRARQWAGDEEVDAALRRFQQFTEAHLGAEGSPPPSREVAQARLDVLVRVWNAVVRYTATGNWEHMRDLCREADRVPEALREAVDAKVLGLLEDKLARFRDDLAVIEEATVYVASGGGLRIGVAGRLPWRIARGSAKDRGRVVAH